MSGESTSGVEMLIGMGHFIQWNTELVDFQVMFSLPRICMTLFQRAVMPEGKDPLDNSTIGEGHLAEPPPTTTSIRSIHSAGDLFTHPADLWLQSAEFYHGYLPREDIPPLLLKTGDFLVRLSE
ncbi:hypothetical protein OSTOST_17073, partial [Ostertagia ostertagi]